MSDPTPNGDPAPRPYISRLGISGFKSIRQAEIELGRLNVLIGANGSGKSNLAGSIRLLAAIADERLQISTQQNGGPAAILHFGPKRTAELALSAQFSYPDDPNVPAGYRIPYKCTLIPTQNDRLLIKSETWRRTLPDRGQWLVASPESTLLPSDSDPVTKMLKTLSVYHLNDTSPEARMRLTGDIDDNRQLRGDGRNLAAFLHGLKHARPKHFDLITRAVRLVAPYFDRFVLEPVKENPRTIQLRWREVGSEDEFGAHQLSDGTLRLIALTALLRQPAADLPSLIFIDEPELSLHPATIAHVAGSIRAAALHTQVIVATQSVEMLNQFDPGDVIVTERHDEATGFKRLNPDELREWLDDYSLGELWEKNVIGGRPSR